MADETLNQASDPGALAAMISRAAHAGDGLPPVERWNPPHCGAIPMRIASDGSWHYDGSPIRRPKLVRLFSTVLRREEDGTHVLVTPVEKVEIEVEDAPFTAVEVTAADGTLTFRTNLGDVTEAGPDRPMRLTDGAAGFKPYVLVRGGLWALATRSVAQELAGMLEEDEGRMVLRSGGVVFGVESGDAA